MKPASKRNPLKTPDIKDPNHNCISCNYTFSSRSNYRIHLIKVHDMSELVRPREQPKSRNMKPTFDILNMYCDVCMSTLGCKKTYIRHLARIHGRSVPDVYSEPSNVDQKI